MKHLRYWFGMNRLRHGYCPMCNSSPPKPSCAVCYGNRSYGHELDTDRRDLWQWRWKLECGLWTVIPPLKAGEQT